MSYFTVLELEKICISWISWSWKSKQDMEEEEEEEKGNVLAEYLNV